MPENKKIDIKETTKKKSEEKKPAPSTATKVETKKKVERKDHEKRRWPIVLVGTAMVLLLLGVVGYLGYEYSYKNKVYSGVTLQGESLGGLTYPEVTDRINAYKDQLDSNGLSFNYDDTSLTVATEMALADESGETATILQIDTDKTAQNIFGVGRSKSANTNVMQKLQHLFSPQDIELEYSIERDVIQSLLENEFAQYETSYANADITFENNELIFTDHSDGKSFTWSKVLDTVEEKILSGEPISITLELSDNPAPVTTVAAESYRSEIEALTKLAPLTLTYEDLSFEASLNDLETWLTLNEDGVILDNEVLDAYIDILAGDIDIPVKEGRFSLDIVNDEVILSQFQAGENGLGVNMEDTIAVIEKALLEDKESTMDLVVEVTEPRATPDNLSNLGITELLGTGTTNFSGSPANRRFNISKGAEMLNGLLIAPQEEFSLITILSPVDTAHGWLSELVIKGDKLEKEAGGGLCQIGTTVFRATMMSGLQVTERRSHSWAVSYYNYLGKAGVDATIYEPSPDYKFVNDTDHWLLIRSRIEGSDLYFEFWGTSDGRNGSFTEPINYGHISPGETEEVLDESKPAGYRDCAQHAYTGVSASFDYNIERPDGTTDTETFTSVYRARPASCIVGPEEEESPEDDTTSKDTTDDTAKDNTTADDAATDDTTDDTTTNDNTNSSKNDTVKKDTPKKNNKDKNKDSNTNSES